MMTPKEKAKELIKRYSCLHHGIDEDILEEVVVSDYAIESSIIAIEEIEKEIYTYYERFEYWKEVKQEIDNLKQ